MPKELINYSIVIVGSMNPAIHNPSWYRRTELIDADAETVALSDLSFVTSSQISQFQTSTFSVQCVQERWRISSDEESSFEKINDVTLKAFDERLPHTPISAVGLNFDYHKKTECSTVSSVLAAFFDDLPLGLSDQDSDSATFKSICKKEGVRVQIKIEPSVVSENMLFVAANYQFNTEDFADANGQFLLEPIIRPNFSKFRIESLERCKTILSSLNSIEEGKTNARTI